MLQRACSDFWVGAAAGLLPPGRRVRDLTQVSAKSARPGGRQFTEEVITFDGEGVRGRSLVFRVVSKYAFPGVQGRSGRAEKIFRLVTEK